MKFILMGMTIITFLCFFYSSKTIKLYKKQIWELNSRITEKEDYNTYFTQIKDTIYYSEIQYNNQPVKDQFCYFGKHSNDNFMLSSFIDKKNVLFFSIPQNVCYSCIQSITQMLEIIFPNYEISNNVVFISQNIEDRFKENLEGKVVMTTSEPIISFRSDFLNESLYFFILDETMEVKHLHFFDKSNISRTNVYLKAVSDIILSHKISYQTNSQKPTK